MARGTITTRTNKDGSVTHYIKYRTVDGTQVKKAVPGGRRQAERALTKALGAVDNGQLRAVARESFTQAATSWLAYKKPRIEPSTYRDYEIHIRLRLIPAFGETRLDKITRPQIERYLSDLDDQGRLSRKTINDSLIPFRQILGRAVRRGVIPHNPALSDDPDDPLELPYETPEIHYLRRDEIHHYLDACSDWYLPIAETLIGTGMRIGELIALEWHDVDWDNDAIRVERSAKDHGEGGTKGDRGRIVYIAPYLLEILERHRDRAASPPRRTDRVFLSPQGAGLDRHNVRRRGHDQAVEDASLSPKLRLHDLRHTAATIWLAAGESIYFVKEQLGHADIQTTIDLYGHPDQAAHRAAAARAAAWWR